MPTNQVLVHTVAGQARLGAVSALVSLARSTGGAAGAAMFGALVFAMIPDADRSSLLQRAGEMEMAAVTQAFHRAFLFAAALAAAAAFTASRIPRVTLWSAAK
jgi:hypothetical protein